MSRTIRSNAPISSSASPTSSAVSSPITKPGIHPCSTISPKSNPAPWAFPTNWPITSASNESRKRVLRARSPHFPQLFTHPFNHFPPPSPTQPPTRQAILESTLCLSASHKPIRPSPCSTTPVPLRRSSPAKASLRQHPRPCRCPPHPPAPLGRLPRLAHRQLLFRVRKRAILHGPSRRHPHPGSARA